MPICIYLSKTRGMRDEVPGVMSGRTLGCLELTAHSTAIGTKSERNDARSRKER